MSAVCSATDAFDASRRWLTSMVRIDEMPQPQVSHIGHLDRSKDHFIAGQKLAAKPATAGASTDQTVKLKYYSTISAAAASSDSCE
jgi:hypothetical protein